MFKYADPEPLTVQRVLHDAFGLFTLAVFMAGVAALVGLGWALR